MKTSARKRRDEADRGRRDGIGAVACVPCATGLHDPYSPRPYPYKSSTHLLMLVVPMCRRWPCAIAALAATIPYWG